MSVMSSTQDPKVAESATHAIGFRVYPDQHAYIERLMQRNDVDRSRLLRRMIRFCQLNMADNWVPPIDD